MPRKAAPKVETFDCEGVVEQLSKPKEVANGKLVYSFKLAEDETWYRTGFDKPNVTVGDQVEFPAAETKWGVEVVAKDITVTGHKEVVKKSSGNAGSKEDYWAEKAAQDADRSLVIGYQASRNAAIAAVTAAVQAELLPLGAKNKYDTFLAAIDDLTNQFFVDAQDLAGLKDLLDTTEIDTTVEGQDDSASSDD